jgi:hypothetical protein
MLHRKCAGFKRDEVYIGTADERAALRAQASKEASEKGEPIGESDALDEHGEYNVRPGHLYPGVPTLPPDFGHRLHTLDDIQELEEELAQHKLDVEKRIKDLQEEKQKLLEMKRVRSGQSQISYTEEEIDA